MQPPIPSGPRIDPTPPRKGLLDRDWRRALIVELTLLVGFALIWVGWLIVSPFLRTIVLFALAAVLAFALARPVESIAQRTGSRLTATALVYLVVAVVVVGGVVLLAGPFVGQASALVQDLPRYADSLQSSTPRLEEALGRFGVQTNVQDVKTRVAAAVEQGGTEVLKNLAGKVAELGGILLDAVLLLVVSFYLVLDGPRIRAQLVGAVPARHRPKAAFFEDHVTRVFGGYLRGQLTLAVVVGLAAGVGTALLGLPYAVVLGVLAGLFELVPMFGPFLSALPAVLIALFMPFPTVVWVVLFFFVLQQVEGNVLVPRISGHAVGLHPLGAMFALLIGFQLAGVLGGLFAVPIAGVVWVLIGAAYRETVEAPPPPRRWPLPPFRRARPPGSPSDHQAA